MTLPNRLSCFALLAVALYGFTSLAHATPADRPATSPTGLLAGHRLQQVALTTRDLPRAVAFYRDTLGMPLLFESNGMAFFDMAGTRLMIGQDARRPDARPTTVLYFDAPEFEATVHALKTLDVPFDGPVETVQSTAAGDLRLQQFRDPDGNALAVMGTVHKP